jgi:hypothetical protein
VQSGLLEHLLLVAELQQFQELLQHRQRGCALVLAEAAAPEDVDEVAEAVLLAIALEA